MFQSPSLISDAVRRLGLSAIDRQAKPVDPRRLGDRNNILRIMTNLLTFSQHKSAKDAETKPLGDLLKIYALQAPRQNSVFLGTSRIIAGGDRKVAVDYIFESSSLADVCGKNAVAARNHGRYDHERVFRTLQALFPTSEQKSTPFSVLAIKIIMEL